MRNPGGYAFLTSPVPSQAKLPGLRCVEVDAGILEIDTYTCCHCNLVIHSKAGTQADEYFCRGCMARICPGCADLPCIPFMKKVEEAERNDRASRYKG